MEYISNVFDWTFAASIVGMVTGVLALFFTWLNYRKVNAMKALDLRLKIGETYNDIDAAVKKVAELHLNAGKSAIVTAYQSGVDRDRSTDNTLFREKWGGEAKIIKKWERQCSTGGSNHLKDTPKELEANYIKLHGKLSEINSLIHSYETSMSEDDKTQADIERHRQQL